MSYSFPYPNPKPYIPASLSEIDDMLASMILWAPTFRSPVFLDRNLDSQFHQLVEGLGRVRKKLGGERYAKLLDLAARAKALFAEDQEDTNGKTREGRQLLREIEELIRQVRARRKATKMKDDEGEVNGD